MSTVIFPFRRWAGFALVMAWMPWGVVVIAARGATPGAPPLPSGFPTPVELFRQLLSTNAEARAQLLVGKTEEQRRVIEQSLQTYASLTPDEREFRLRSLELRFRLNALLRMATSERSNRLEQVPQGDRALLTQRLQAYDRLPTEEQAALLENEKMAWHLLFGQTGAPRHVALNEQTSNRLRQIETQLLRWQTLPEPRREQILSNFRRVYGPGPTNQDATPQWLQLPAEERAKIYQSLRQFGSLAPAQREQCMSNFTRFAQLSPADRRQFLLNAEKWQQFKPEEREAWRKLVSRMPPLPPYIMRPPPLPPGHASRPVTTQVATN